MDRYQDDSTKTPPQPYSHLTYTQYRSLILRETEPPFSSTLPLLPSARENTQRLSVDPNAIKDTNSDNQETGEVPSYVCANCSTPLFPASAKFASGSGWPSFASALPGAIKTKTDWRVKEAGKWVLGGSLGVKFREEVVCRNCGGHLGHVFRGENWEGVEEEEQGKGITRYCVNGSSLKVPGSQKESEVTNLG
ncbi:Thioredoxin [Arthrobotrys entomopaga]|nr:Thioredoxin [Arthrobotrys entomopaga]